MRLLYNPKEATEVEVTCGCTARFALVESDFTLASDFVSRWTPTLIWKCPLCECPNFLDLKHAPKPIADAIIDRVRIAKRQLEEPGK